MKETRLINRFPEKKKKSHLGKWAIFGPKIVHPLNSGSAGRIFFKFCTVKVDNRQMRIILIILQKKFVWVKWTILGPKMVHPQNSGSDVRIF